MNLSSRLLRLIRQKSIIFSAALMLLLVIANAGFLMFNNGVLERTMATQLATQAIKDNVSLIWEDVVRNIDVGVRGYALTKDEGLLLPYHQAKDMYPDYQQNLQQQLIDQGYPDMVSFNRLKTAYKEYFEYSAYMVELINSDQDELFKQELKKDRGLALWKIYEKYSREVNAYQDQLYSQATARYQTANTLMTYIQIILAIVGVPTLLFMITRINKDERARRDLFEELEENNRKYLFNPGTPVQVNNERELINNSIVNFKKAASFISEVSTGNLEVSWEELSEENKHLNQNNLTGELINMREKMKELKAEDARRMWATEGLAQFSDIIRNNQHDLETLCNQAVSFTVKYLAAQQGAAFILREEEEGAYLEMVGCYAFNKKKYDERRVEIGQGLVGQVYLEKEPSIMTELPQAYTYITSGLGDATPTCLMIVPMIYNEKVEAVIEVAGFKKWEKYQLEWLSKIGEIMASTLIAIKTTEKTQRLLEQFQDQTEQMRAQEEELRQNMEEMEATQEEMRRKEEEMERRQLQMQELLRQQNT